MSDSIICDICGTTSPKGVEACIYCGCQFSTVDVLNMSVERSEPLGADQIPQLHVALYDFLASGSFGGIRPRMTKSDVQALSGLPAEFHRGKTLDEAEIWINGKVTFWFNGEALERIGVYYILEYSENSAIEYGSEFPERNTCIQTLREFMHKNEIDFIEQPDASLLTSIGTSMHASSDGKLLSIVYPHLLSP